MDLDMLFNEDRYHRGSFATLQNYAENGFRSVTEARGRQQATQKRITEAARFLEQCKRHPHGEMLIREAFSTSDFPLSFSWFTDRVMLAQYRSAPGMWNSIFKRTTVPDFRAAARDRIQGVDLPMNAVAQGEDYENDQKLIGSRDQSVQVKKYGRTFPILFESSVNDVLDQLTGLPAALALAARRTEDYQASKAYVANSTVFGTHSVTFQDGTSKSFVNKGTAGLSVEALRAGLNFFYSLRDDVGNPIVVRSITLVVPPLLEVLADAILAATNLWYNTNPAAGTQEIRYETPNYLAPRLNRQTDYYLPILDATHGDTSWYLFASPGDLALGEVAFLRGQEDPALFMRSPNAIRISDAGALGGMTNPLDGAFENDTLAYKVRHITGASAYEWRAGYWSDGTT